MIFFDFEGDFAQQKGATFLKLFRSQCDEHSITQL